MVTLPGMVSGYDPLQPASNPLIKAWRPAGGVAPPSQGPAMANLFKQGAQAGSELPVGQAIKMGIGRAGGPLTAAIIGYNVAAATSNMERNSGQAIPTGIASSHHSQVFGDQGLHNPISTLGISNTQGGQAPARSNVFTPQTQQMPQPTALPIAPFDMSGYEDKRMKFLMDQFGNNPDAQRQGLADESGNWGVAKIGEHKDKPALEEPKFFAAAHKEYDYDPRAENAVNGLHDQAQSHLGAQQNLQQDWLNANMNNIGRSPLAALASFGAVNNGINAVGNTMATRGKAALDTMSPINTAVKEGNTNPQANVTGQIKDRSALAEIKNKNMFPSELEQAHTNYYNKQADAVVGKVDVLKHQQDLRVDAQNERLNQHLVDAATKLAGGDPEKYPAALSSVMESYRNEQAGMKYNPPVPAIPGSFPYGFAGMGTESRPEVKGSYGIGQGGSADKVRALVAQHGDINKAYQAYLAGN